LSRSARLSLLAVAWALTGCAHALKTPPTLQEIAGPASPGETADPARLFEEANTLFARRDVASARTAATLALRAAAATTPPQPGALLLAIRILVWLAEHEEDSEARGQTDRKSVV